MKNVGHVFIFILRRYIYFIMTLGLRQKKLGDRTKLLLGRVADLWRCRRITSHRNMDGEHAPLNG